ncbi:MAG: ribose-phosphate diphosphokinase [Rhodoferax sp.]|nr:ribose-phosphate diphosphokinase [Rhodoferax sp.]
MTTLLHFEEDLDRATAIALAAKLRPAVMHRHRFPDGEVKLRLPTILDPQVVLLRSLDHPNEKLLELMLVAQAAREFGAQHLTLVAPYLAYMRQDMAFSPGEVVSQRVVGKFLGDLFDAVITVDPHLHRVSTLAAAVPARQAIALSAAPLLSDLIAAHHSQPLLLGPDEESIQWVAQAAVRHGFDYGVCKKTRHGDRDVDIALPPIAVVGRAVVLIDDVASSGHTLARAASLLGAAGASTVDVAVTHALFADNAMEILKHAGVGKVWSTDCIPHSSNAVSMAPLIAESLMALFSQEKEL